jgi:hypothetical protein
VCKQLLEGVPAPEPNFTWEKRSEDEIAAGEVTFGLEVADDRLDGGRSVAICI